SWLAGDWAAKRPQKSARDNWLTRLLVALAAFGRFLALLGRLLVAGKRLGLGLLALVPRLAAIAATWWQAGVLSKDLLLLAHFVATRRGRVLAAGTLVSIGLRLVRRN